MPSSGPSAASWRYHPSHAGEIYAERKVDSLQAVFAGARGERWLVDLKSGQASSSAWLAPETLVGIAESSEGAWQFVGTSGTVYEAGSPLGPFERSNAPPLPFVTVHAESGPIVGVRADGSLSLSADGGLSWRSVGPQGVRFADAAVDEHGRVLALATPEAIWSSVEGGSDWSRLPVETFGALEIVRSIDGGLCARGVLGVRCWQPEQRSLLPFAGKLAPRAHKLDARLPHGEDAAALAEGHAVISQGRYFELVRAPRWRLLSGPFGGPLRARDAGPLKDCHTVRISAFGPRLAVGCIVASPQGRTAQTVRFFASADQGQTWTEEPFVSRASSELRLASGAGGALLVTGICPPHQSQAGCVPSGIYFRSRSPRGLTGNKTNHAAKQPWALLRAAAAGLSGVAEALAFSPDGAKAYAVGSYSKTGTLALFVSRDQGRHLQARDLEPQSSVGAASSPANQRAPAARRVEGLGTLPDGTVSVVFRGTGGHPTLVVTDEAGRSLSSVGAPAETKLLVAAGSRALAFSPDTTTLFESLDGGSRWERTQPLPVLLCVRDRDCRVPVQCSAEGCVFTDAATRVGWGTASEQKVGLLPPPEAEAARSERRLRTPIACVFEPDTEWKRIDGADSLPTAAQSALGTTVWFVTTADPNRASVGMALVERSRGQVTELSMLAPVRAPEEYALALVSQVEGAAAMRYRTPESTNSPALRDIEVVWDNLFEGQLRRARIGDAGAYEPDDYAKTSERSQRAQPSLLSIAQGGIYVMPHQAAGANQPAYFLDGKRVLVLPPFKWPALRLLSAHTEMTHVRGHHVGLAFVKGGAAVVVGRREGNATSVAAQSLGLMKPDSFGIEQSIDMTYLAGQPALFSQLSTRSGEGQSFVFPLEPTGPALGAPIAVPGRASVADPPRACDRAIRESTPRLVLPSPIGAVHPVLVTGGTEPARAMLTSQAVVHGTPAAPCVAVLESQGVVLGDAETTQERALLPLDQLERSWLFRLVERTEIRSVEVRPMRCRFDPQAAVVPELTEVVGGERRNQD
ncbi:MAG: hypothetical protein JW940_10220 [Polyangiaceae bacterium]|nr:hypothetical protein [Polyangiaceae bacterium]